jgi:hypothetical protein
VRRLFAVAMVLGSLVLLVGAGPVAAFPLNGCTMSLTSNDGAGAPIDSAASGGPVGSMDNPLIVDWDGSVVWSGTTGTQTIKNNSYHIEVFGIPTPFGGHADNGDGNQSGSGLVSIKDNAPFRFTGLYFVTGGISGAGGACDGNGWLKVTGDPVGTIPFFVGLVLVIVGILLLVGGLRGSIVAAILGGLLLGVGLAILLVIFSALPVGGMTPLASVVFGLLVGIIASFVGRAASRAPA